MPQSVHESYCRSLRRSGKSSSVVGEHSYSEHEMKNTVLVVLIVASALLVSIIGVAGVVAVRRANRINEDIVKSNAKSQASGRTVEGLRADFDATRIEVRDFMLYPVAGTADAKRAEF